MSIEHLANAQCPVRPPANGILAGRESIRLLDPIHLVKCGEGGPATSSLCLSLPFLHIKPARPVSPAAGNNGKNKKLD